jgi:hypothetical protein
MDRRPDPGPLKLTQKFKEVEIPQRQREIESEIEVAVAIVMNVMPQPGGIRGIINEHRQSKNCGNGDDDGDGKHGHRPVRAGPQPR